MIVVELDPADRVAIRCEALRRHQYAEFHATTPRWNGPGLNADGLNAHRYGAAGEYAVAKYLGLLDHVFRETHPVRGSPDLPGDIDVKTRQCHRWDLIVALDDDPTKRYVLVTIENRTIAIRGWIPGAEARRPEFLSSVPGRPRAYFVPVSALYPIDTLR